MERELAIIIPAFKPDFLKKAIQSIDNQKNKNFQVYIGNDGSPHDLYEICAPFVEKNNWVYKPFELNIGRDNLIGHWNRCIELSSEKWIWLFSDDDEMNPDCVEQFYTALQKHPSTNVFKFDFSIINQNSSIIRSNEDIYTDLSGFEFGKLRFERKLFSSAVEFVFSRNSYKKAGGFIRFPAAWCSDDASWIAFTEQLPIRKIEGGMVFWRISEVNISGGSDKFRKEKVKAALEYIKWFNLKFPDVAKSTLFGEQMIWLRLQLVQNHTKLSFTETLRILSKIKPKGLLNLLRTFNELFLRNRMIQDAEKGLQISPLTLKVSKFIGKY
jgi:glycosyltransferase involved in cell wall biosynthesis